eukprot:4656675-Amphidinium_carterae.1
MSGYLVTRFSVQESRPATSSRAHQLPLGMKNIPPILTTESLPKEFEAMRTQQYEDSYTVPNN